MAAKKIGSERNTRLVVSRSRKHPLTLKIDAHTVIKVYDIGHDKQLVEAPPEVIIVRHQNPESDKLD